MMTIFVQKKDQNAEKTWTVPLCRCLAEWLSHLSSRGLPSCQTQLPERLHHWVECQSSPLHWYDHPVTRNHCDKRKKCAMEPKCIEPISRTKMKHFIVLLKLDVLFRVFNTRKQPKSPKAAPLCTCKQPYATSPIDGDGEPARRVHHALRFQTKTVNNNAVLTAN